MDYILYIVRNIFSYILILIYFNLKLQIRVKEDISDFIIIAILS